MQINLQELPHVSLTAEVEQLHFRSNKRSDNIRTDSVVYYSK